MQIEILQQLQGAKNARGLAVIIDVFRAFTVEAYAYAHGIGQIYAVGDINRAYELGREMPGALLVGERNGVMCEGFDCGNTPSELVKLSLTGKTMIHTTSAGTQGIANAKNADEVLTGSLTNARAIARYILAKNPEHVSLVCMGWNANEETAEDTLCAEYIRALLLGEDSDISVEMADLARTTGAKFFDPAQQAVFPQGDFACCVNLNAFDFVLRAHPENDYFRMERIDI